MANKKKAKKVPKKKLSPEAKDKIKTGFATLINNEACVKASREWTGWWNLIPVGLAIASIVLAVTPTFVQRMSIKGGDTFLARPTNGLDASLATFTSDLVKSSTHIEIKDGKVKVTNWEALTGGTNKWYQVYNSETNIVQFEVFYNNTEYSDNTFINNVLACLNPYDLTSRGKSSFVRTTANVPSLHKLSDSEETLSSETVSVEASSQVASSSSSTSEPDTAWEKYHINYLIFGKTKGRIGKFGQNTKATDTFVDLIYSGINGRDFYKLGEELNQQKTKDYNPEKFDDRADLANKQWKKVINDSYNDAKKASAWGWTGIMAGTYAGLILVFGFVLFLLTRGKKNPYRVYTLWDTQKIAYWSAVAPAILSLLGFITASYSFFFFIVLYGLRIMWMTMKVFSPARQGIEPNKK